MWVKESIETGPPVQVLDNQCRWRNEDHFPPHDARWTTMTLTADHKLALLPDQRGDSVLISAQDVPGAVPRVDFSTGALLEGIRFSGLPKLHVAVTPLQGEGYLYAGLFDEAPDGKRVQIGTTAMNLRYYPGGETRQVLQPGEEIVAKMEIYPLDVYVPAGHSLVLGIGQSSGLARDHTSAGSQRPAPVELAIGGTKSLLTLPLIQRVDSVFFTPPQPPGGQVLNEKSGPRS